VRHYVTYTGSRTHDAAEPSDVFRIEPGKEPTRIDWRLDLINHSPNGLSWGYSGSAPAQCALAILADFLEDNDALAVRLHQDFKLRFVARFPAEWRLGGRTIRRWLTGGGADKEERLQPRVVLNVVEADGVYQMLSGDARRQDDEGPSEDGLYASVRAMPRAGGHLPVRPTPAARTAQRRNRLRRLRGRHHAVMLAGEALPGVRQEARESVDFDFTKKKPS
jgi:hypothetical protein